LNSDGVENPSYLDFANLIDLIPEVIMIGLFVLISKGWQISEANFGRLYSNDKGGKRTTVEYLIFYLGCSIALYAWSLKEGKPYETKFIYQSAPGYMIMALHLLTAFWFISNLIKTARHARILVVRAFYVVFAFFGVSYMLVLPICIVVAEFLYDYNRSKAVIITQIVLNLFVYVFFFLIFGLNAHHLKKDIQEGMAFGGPINSSFDDGMIDIGANVETAELDEVEFENE